VRLPADDTPLEATARVSALLADEALRDADVVSVQSYTGTASPYTFNGLVRHYFLRREAHMADLQLMLTAKDEPRDQSPPIAGRLRAQPTPPGKAPSAQGPGVGWFVVGRGGGGGVQKV